MQGVAFIGIAMRATAVLSQLCAMQSVRSADAASDDSVHDPPLVVVEFFSSAILFTAIPIDERKGGLIVNVRSYA